MRSGIILSQFLRMFLPTFTLFVVFVFVNMPTELQQLDAGPLVNYFPRSKSEKRVSYAVLYLLLHPAVLF